MSDFPHGPDWWQASDGQWYPPEAHPQRQPHVAPRSPASQRKPKASFFAGYPWGRYYFRLAVFAVTALIGLWVRAANNDDDITRGSAVTTTTRESITAGPLVEQACFGQGNDYFAARVVPGSRNDVAILVYRPTVPVERYGHAGSQSTVVACVTEEARRPKGPCVGATSPDVQKYEADFHLSVRELRTGAELATADWTQGPVVNCTAENYQQLPDGLGGDLWSTVDTTLGR